MNTSIPITYVSACRVNFFYITVFLYLKDFYDNFYQCIILDYQRDLSQKRKGCQNTHSHLKQNELPNKNQRREHKNKVINIGTMRGGGRYRELK